MLEVKNISSGYGKKQVLYDISLQVNKGEVVLLTGGNGSGKSTLLKCIYNILPCWSGEIFFEGEKINGLIPSDLIRKGIVYIPQKHFCFENLSVQENLQVSGSIYSQKLVRKKIEHIFDAFPKLASNKKLTPFNLSGGEKKLLAFGMALIHTPKLISFDEPIAGLDKVNTKIIIDKIFQLNEKQNIGFLTVEHRKNIMANKILKLKLGKL